MSHVDDGKLNALLDGELEAAEANEVRAHLGSCAECARRLEEAKRFLSEAANLLGALELPSELGAPAEPARRVSKTAKEVAIDIDGATQKSPAIRANFPDRPAHGASGVSHRLDFTTLAWAATIVLAVGVGYLANEVRHARQRLVIGEDGAAGMAAAAPAANPAQRSAAGRPSAAPSPAAAKVAAAPSHTSRARKPTAPAGKALARGTAPPRRQNAPAAGAATELVATGGAGARAAEPAAPAAARAEGRLDVANAPIAVTGVAAPRGPLAAFRRATLEEAVGRLDGTIQLIDGLSAERVEVGPGRLVPGADRSRDLVRVIYYQPGGVRLQLDQQRVGTSAGVHGALSADVGMGSGDTLTTAAPNGQVRVRWIDGAFWLSLTGNLPPDSLRRLVARVH